MVLCFDFKILVQQRLLVLPLEMAIDFGFPIFFVRVWLEQKFFERSADAAIRRLEGALWVGVTERMTEAICLLFFTLRKSYHPLGKFRYKLPRPISVCRHRRCTYIITILVHSFEASGCLVSHSPLDVC